MNTADVEHYFVLNILIEYTNFIDMFIVGIRDLSSIASDHAVTWKEPTWTKIEITTAISPLPVLPCLLHLVVVDAGWLLFQRALIDRRLTVKEETRNLF